MEFQTQGFPPRNGHPRTGGPSLPPAFGGLCRPPPGEPAGVPHLPDLARGRRSAFRWRASSARLAMGVSRPAAAMLASSPGGLSMRMQGGKTGDVCDAAMPQTRRVCGRFWFSPPPAGGGGALCRGSVGRSAAGIAVGSCGKRGKRARARSECDGPGAAGGWGRGRPSHPSHRQRRSGGGGCGKRGKRARIPSIRGVVVRNPEGSACTLSTLPTPITLRGKVGLENGSPTRGASPRRQAAALPLRPG